MSPCPVSVEDADNALGAVRCSRQIRCAPGFRDDDGMTTDTALGDGRESIGPIPHGYDRTQLPMRHRAVPRHLKRAQVAQGQHVAPMMIPPSKDRMMSVPGDAVTSRTVVLNPSHALGRRQQIPPARPSLRHRRR